MSIREIDLAQFSEFARQQIEAGRGDVSLSSLVEQWERRQQSIQVHESPEHRNPQVARARAYVEILAQQQGVVPVRSADDLRFDFLNSSQELDEFLSTIRAARQQDKVRDPLND